MHATSATRTGESPGPLMFERLPSQLDQFVQLSCRLVPNHPAVQLGSENPGQPASRLTAVYHLTDLEKGHQLRIADRSLGLDLHDRTRFWTGPNLLRRLHALAFFYGGRGRLR